MLLGIDIGTSSVKVAVVDPRTKIAVAVASFPEEEAPIIASQPGWAEQSPEDWWQYTKQAIAKLIAQKSFDPLQVSAIGIAYQMHGLVLVDKEHQLVRNSIIWCDSRAVSIGQDAYDSIGHDKCLTTLLNSPGNFTAAKLAWVKKNEPSNYQRTYKFMLPGDLISMKLTGEINSTISGLSEGIFWDFSRERIAADISQYFGFDDAIFPEIKQSFEVHGHLLSAVAAELGLKAGIPISYKAGDQPNTAFSLNVHEPGEFAANAGTSGVIYGITDRLTYDKGSRINGFAHVNHTAENIRIGLLLCINGAGIAPNWIRSLSNRSVSYEELNQKAGEVKAGAEGLKFFPFGNGAERIFGNHQPGASVNHINFNQHSVAHVYRAAIESVAYAFRYGFDIILENGMKPSVIRAGHANMFQGEIFQQVFTDLIGVPLELYRTDGSIGAAIGAGVGAGYFTVEQAMGGLRPGKTISPSSNSPYETLYHEWKNELMNHIQQQ